MSIVLKEWDIPMFGLEWLTFILCNDEPLWLSVVANSLKVLKWPSLDGSVNSRGAGDRYRWQICQYPALIGLG